MRGRFNSSHNFLQKDIALNRSKNFTKGVGALALVTSLLLSLQIPLTASATEYAGSDSSGPNVLIFTKDPFTDTLEEDTDIRNALIPISSKVTTFDGGDGSASAWTIALSGIDALIFPEVDGTTYWDTTDTAVLDAAAKAYIKSWVSAGNLIIGTGSYSHLQAITDLTAVDFTGLGDNSLSNGAVWDLQVSSSTLPATVPNANYAGGITNYSALSSEQKSVTELVYYNSDEDNAGVVNFKVGSGYYIYNAYDWYPDAGDVTSGARADWNQTLQFAATGQFTAAPVLPAYSGPLLQSSATSAKSSGDVLTFSGLRLKQLLSGAVDGSAITILSQSADSITIQFPELSAGVKDIHFIASTGKYIAQEAFNVQAAAVSNKKVNAGSFKGYVAVYAKGYEGHRLSAKVGADWVIVPSIPAATNDLYRHVEFTGAGVDVAVRIYIDRVLVDTINLTTK